MLSQYQVIVFLFQGMIFEINKDACVSDPYRTVSGVFSLSVCSQLCLSDDSCKAITFMSDTNDCQLSDTEDTHVCSLLEGGGTLTEPPEPGSKKHEMSTHTVSVTTSLSCVSLIVRVNFVQVLNMYPP